jgi:flavin reductase (DIM6/NTAB) family NADH-FMN oxidoreductase RutF
MSRKAFSEIMASLDPALVVVTTAVDQERAGCLVGFHAQSSIDPDRYCIWLSKANYTYRVALRASHLGVHFLTADDLELAELFGEFTGDTSDKFIALKVSSGPGGIPVLDDVAHRIVVRRTALLDEGGDHVCLTNQVVSADSAGRFRPLRLSQASHLIPGHENEERPSPLDERAAPA